MGKSIILVHGRDFKPPREALRDLYVSAVRLGLQRDHPARLAAFDQATIDFVYYGDLSNAFLSRVRGVPIPDDAASRWATLDLLTQWSAADFNRMNYESLPGRSGVGEAIADTLGGLLSALRLSDPIIEAVAPDMREYWNSESEFGSRVRSTMIAPLVRAMDRGDDILVIAHSLGSLISYDTFWKFSRTAEYRPAYSEKPISLWITIGAPLADETIKRNLKGAGRSGLMRYPANIQRWVNVAAHDDYISHDQRVADDYRAMLEHGLIQSIEDRRVYNLSLRHGKSNPHHEGGYLIHPVVAQLVADWL
jgi:hypothetical protein